MLSVDCGKGDLGTEINMLASMKLCEGNQPFFLELHGIWASYLTLPNLTRHQF